MKEKDLGSFFQDKEGTLFKMIGYWETPTVILQKVGSKDRVTLAVGSLHSSMYQKIPNSLQESMKQLDTQYETQVSSESVQTCADCDCGKANRCGT